jgi:hypothetical protein
VFILSMMMTVSVDLSSIEHWLSGSITGRICLSVGDVYFPESEWSDYPVVLLAWWLVALDGAAPVLRFMDGPFSVKLSRGLNSAQLVRGESVIATTMNIDVEKLHRSVRGAARAVVARCDQLGASGDEIDALRTRLLL